MFKFSEEENSILTEYEMGRSEAIYKFTFYVSKTCKRSENDGFNNWSKGKAHKF